MSNRTDPSVLMHLQKNLPNIRNFCILAHVDHGKTTLSDSLVSSNGIISSKLAGKLRFLDSTEEEQKRGITMHSSAISLYYKLEDKSGETKDAIPEEYLINLVDSPGHIDFSSDVSTAARLCDGALIIVDVLEGVCTQTHAVVYKALRERMRPCLVLNKIDRLIVELRLTPTEAFNHLRRIIENVNALTATLVNSELIKQAELSGNSMNVIDIDENHPLIQTWTFSPEKGNVQFASALDGWGFGLMKFINIWHKKLGLNKGILKKYLFEDYSINLETKKITKYDSSDYSKSPLFAQLVLEPLWEIYDLIVIKQDLKAAVEYVKENMQIELPPREVNPRDFRATLQSIMRRWLPLADSILRMVVKNMPNPKEAQAERVETLTGQINTENISKDIDEASKEALKNQLQKISTSIQECDSSPDAPLLVFISKMMPVRVSELAKQDLAMLNDRLRSKATDPSLVEELKPDQEVFVALGRVFSGTLTRNSDLYVIGHKYDPFSLLSDPTLNDSLVSPDNKAQLNLQANLIQNSSMITKVNYGEGKDKLGCYLLLGPSVTPADSVPAGNIVGILGLEDFVFKTATLSNSWASFPMKAITFQAKPMLKVAVEPISHKDLKNLENGLQSLYQYDPVVEVGIDDSGQHTMTCLGELHLDQCVKALIEKFAKCEINVSEPLITFRETIVPRDEDTGKISEDQYKVDLPPPWCDIPNIKQTTLGKYRMVVDNQNIAISFKSYALPLEAMNVWEQESSLLQEFGDYLNSIYYHPSLYPEQDNDLFVDYEVKHKSFEKLWHTFESQLQEKQAELVNNSYTNNSISFVQFLRQYILSIGSRNCPGNILAFHPDVKIDIYRNHLPASSSISSDLIVEQQLHLGSISFSSKNTLFRKLWQRLHSSVIAGFQSCVSSGPLMNEPIYGVGFIIEKIELLEGITTQLLNPEELIEAIPQYSPPETDSEKTILSLSSSIQTGQLISDVQEALKLCILSSPMRIVEPIYQCDLQCDQSQLGNLYAVLSRRRGSVFKEDIIEGTNMFILTAYLPVAQSFQFAQELLKKTSGNGTAPQLSFSHWQLLPQDPFWKPRTEDEKEEFGDQAFNDHNIAKNWIVKIRKRKGLACDEQIVVNAEKQRTLKK